MKAVHWKWLLCLGVFAFSPTARAQDRERALLHYNAAVRHIQYGEHRAAIGEFEEAYLASHHPSFLYNIAQSYRALGEGGSVDDTRRAIQFYWRYLAAARAAPDRPQVEAMIAELEARLTRSAPPPPEPSASPAPPPPPPAVPAENEDKPLRPRAPPAPTADTRPEPPRRAAFPVLVLPRNADDTYEIEAETGGLKHACSTPCELLLPSARLRISVSGPRQFAREVDLPKEPSTVRIGHLSVTTYVVGGVLSALASASLGLALGLGLSDNVYLYSFGAGGGALLGLGVACLALGGRDRIEVLPAHLQ
jgi:hypothetical protein